MKRILMGLGALLILIFVGIAVSAYLIPSSVYKSQIESAASEALARDVQLNGDVSVSVFPRIAATVEDVVIANPEGFSDDPFATAGSLRAAVKWLPLITRRVEVASLSFDRADINLVRTADGRANWEIGSEPTSETNEETSSGGQSFDAAVDRARLTNSSITYNDAVAGQSYVVENIDLTARLRALDKPLDLSGSARVNDEDFDFSLDLASLAGLLDGDATDIKAEIASGLADARYDGAVGLGDQITLAGTFSLAAPDIPALFAFAQIDNPGGDILGSASADGAVSGTLERLALSDLSVSHRSDLLTVNFDGSVEMSDTPLVNGTMSARSDDLRALATALEIDLPEGDDVYQRFRLAADVSSDANRYDLSLSEAELDRLSMTGDMSVDMSGKVPEISAALATSELDLTPYTGSGAAAAETSEAPSEGWSTEPLMLGVLQSANGRATLTSPAITLDTISLTDVDLLATLENGRLILTINNAQSFEGNLIGQVSLTGRDAPQASELATDFTGSEVSAGALVAAFTGYDVISGFGAINLDSIQTRGASMDEMVRNLRGDMTVGLAEGALRGVNLAQLYRTAEEFLTSGAVPTAFSPGMETDFTSFDLISQIENGVAELQPVTLVGPGIRMEATGTIDLANQTFNIRPVLTSDDAEAVTVSIGGLDIPVSELPWRIGGSWSSPGIGLDETALQTLVQNRLQSELSNQILDQVGSDSPLGSVLDGLLGTNTGSDQSSEESTSTDEDEEEGNELEDVLNNLFERRQ